MAPFKPYLLSPSFINAGQLGKRIGKDIPSFFKWNDAEKWLSGAEKTTILDSEKLFLLLIMTQFWGYRIGEDFSFLISSDARKFTARICGYTGNNIGDHKEFRKLLLLIEDYYRLQLCKRILLPFKGKTDILEGMGYQPFQGQDEMLETQLKAEYNLYTKELQAGAFHSG